MTTSTSRPASAASTASRWPGPERREPEQLVQRPVGVRARARPAPAGGGPRPGRREACPSAVDTDWRPYRRRPDAASACQARRCAELSHSARCGDVSARASGKRVLERVLALRRDRAGQRVLAGEAGVAVRLARAADRLVDAVERQVRQRVGAQLGGDLGLRAAVGDHLLARRHVDPVVAGMADRRRGDAHVHLAGARRRAASARSGASCCRARSSRRRRRAACRATTSGSGLNFIRRPCLRSSWPGWMNVRAT